MESDYRINKMAKKKIAIYGGTFDPIHFGHINLALEICEKKKIDEVWFCPAYKNPLKDYSSINAEHRVSMLKLAIADISHFKLLDIEVYKQEPSYTVNTLHRLVSSEFGLASDQLSLIIGVDAFLHFSEWKEPATIVKLAELIIGTRLTIEPTQLNCVLERWGIPLSSLVTTRILEISSTEIRNRLKSRLYCGHLLHSKVIDYIYQHHLY